MIVVTLVIFGIFFIGPGPAYVARRLAGRSAPQSTVDLIRRRLLLNRPLYVQYLHFFDRLVFHHDQGVTTVLKEAWPVDLSLALGGGAIWIVLGVLSGVLSAVKRGSILDRV